MTTAATQMAATVTGSGNAHHDIPLGREKESQGGVSDSLLLLPGPRHLLAAGVWTVRKELLPLWSHRPKDRKEQTMSTTSTTSIQDKADRLSATRYWLGYDPRTPWPMSTYNVLWVYAHLPFENCDCYDTELYYICCGEVPIFGTDPKTGKMRPVEY